ncbi:MAG: HEAT repeat domain-containing protein [Terriglobia bacterium]
MRKARFISGFVLSWLALAAVPAAAQQPRIANARLETRSAASGLQATVRAIVERKQEPAWIGYAVPMIPGEHRMCCHDSSDCCGGCRLEGGSGFIHQRDSDEPILLEGGDRLLVLLRVAGRRVQKIRPFSEGCALDAGGLQAYWLTDADPAQSVRLLASYVERYRYEADPGEDAVAAIAFHAGEAADQTLSQFAEPARPEWLRKKTAFWLGAARGRRGFQLLQQMLEKDPSAEVQEKVVFGLYVSKQPEATEALIRAARSHRRFEVRKKALFWVGQKAGKQAAAAIVEVIEHDPNLDLKKRAVFALSQLPQDEGVPLLIRVARTHKHPVIRKKAIFWLGQSNDPRALAFFEEVLAR